MDQFVPSFVQSSNPRDQLAQLAVRVNPGCEVLRQFGVVSEPSGQRNARASLCAVVLSITHGCSPSVPAA
jgi:hypothetical protein